MLSCVSPLKIACLNIEKNNHFEKFIPVLREADIDVICLQEVPEDKVSYLESEIGATSLFLGTTIRTDTVSGVERVYGLAILVRRGVVVGWDTHVYHHATPEDIPLPADRALLLAIVEKDDVCYRIGNTHFTWTPDGEVSDQQFEDIDALFGVIDDHVGNELILCGDFNAPREKFIWEMLACRYRDNIPPLAVTTLDQMLHRAAPINYVVDGMFTSKHYAASEVALTDKVSDHMLITGKITRVA